MVVFDCCPFMYAPLVTRPPSCTQRVVLLFVRYREDKQACGSTVA